MNIVEQKFEDIHYRYIKNDTNQSTLVFLHGFTGSSLVWNDYVDKLKNKFSIILIDLAGHGDSETPKKIEEYSFENQAGKIVKILNELKIEKATIVSYSLSCYIGLHIQKKMKNKVKLMVFVSPYFKEKINFIEKLIFKFIKLIWKYLVPDKKYKLNYSKIKNYENPSFLDTRYTLKCINTKDVLGSVWPLIHDNGIPNLERLKIPQLIIYGKNDKMFSEKIKNIFSKIKEIEMKAVENKKHLFLKTEAEKVAWIIEEFLIKQLSRIPR